MYDECSFSVLTYDLAKFGVIKNTCCWQKVEYNSHTDFESSGPTTSQKMKNKAWRKKMREKKNDWSIKNYQQF